MYFLHGVWHENLVTMETRIRIDAKIVTVSFLYDRKSNLLNLRGIQPIQINVYINENVQGGGIHYPQAM